MPGRMGHRENRLARGSSSRCSRRALHAPAAGTAPPDLRSRPPTSGGVSVERNNNPFWGSPHMIAWPRSEVLLTAEDPLGTLNGLQVAPQLGGDPCYDDRVTLAKKRLA